MSEIKAVPGGKIVGVKTAIFSIMNQEKYDPAAIPAAWDEFWAKFPTSGIVDQNSLYGITIPSNDFNTPMDHYVGALIDASEPTPAGFAEFEFAAGNYFCVKHSGPISGLGATYGLAYGQEFPAAGIEIRNAPHIEIYDSSKDPMSADFEMLIGIPVN